MSCADIQNELSSLLYGELEARQAAIIEKHLDQCAACREELAALRHTRRVLSSVSTPAVHVDVPRLLEIDAERQRRHLADALRRWRRWAFAATAAAAAVVLIALSLNLEIRAEAHQLVLRWGSPPDATPAAVGPNTELAKDANQALQAQLVLLTQLGQGLTETSARDARQRKELIELEAKHRKELDQLRETVRSMQQQAGWRLAALHRDIDALYAAVFGVNKKGAAE